MKRFSLRSQIILLLLVVMLPGLFLLFYSAYEQRQAAVKELEQKITTNVGILNGLMGQKAEGARSLLISLSYSPAILNRDSVSCSKLLAGIIKHNPQYTNLGVADPDGNIVCSIVPMTKPVNASDKAWFQRTIKSNDIAFGDYQIGRIVDKPVIIMGYAARDESGMVRTAIFVPFDLTELSRISKQVNLPQSTAFLILDRNGTILTRSPDHEKWVGKTIKESGIIKTILTQHEGLIETEGVDGIRRIYSFAPVAGTDNSIFISIGIPKDIVFANINKQFIRNLIILSLLAALSFVAALIISRLARQSEEELRITNEELLAINRIVTTITTINTVKQILESILNEALHITGLEGGTICLVTSDETLHLAVHRETSEATIRDLTTNEVKIGECLCGECARDHKPLILWNREGVLKFSPREAQRGEDIRFHAAFPLIIKDRCLGVLCLFTRTDFKPAERRLRLLETVTSQIAIAVDNAQMFEEISHHAAILEDKVLERTRELQESQRALTNLVEDLNEKSTMLQDANEKLKEVDRLKSMFIASMSHELRTPLNSVIGFSSILLNEWIGPLNEEQKLNMTSILKSGRHLLLLINDVIDVSKIEAGAIETYEEDFDVYDVIMEAVNSLSKEIKDKGLELKVESIHVQMHTDRRRLFQCVLNLLSNAMKFTEKGSVHIRARAVNSEQYLVNSKKLFTDDYSLTTDRNFMEISVTDTGIGIKKEDIPKLFTAFTRLESHLKATVPGTGLGLYLTKKLVTEVLKGDIMVESRAGEGSRFLMRIPVSVV